MAGNFHGISFNTEEIVKSNLSWENSRDNTDVYYYPQRVLGVHPEHALTEHFGTLGASNFKSGDLSFEIEDGVRGINIKAVIVFNEEGKGLVFYK